MSDDEEESELVFHDEIELEDFEYDEERNKDSKAAKELEKD